MSIRFRKIVLLLLLLNGLCGRRASASAVTEVHSSWHFLFFSAVALSLLLILAFLFTRRLEIVPRGLQNLFELALETVYGIPEMVMGPRGKEYATLVCPYFLYILTMNLMAIVPGMTPGTSSLSITVAFGLVAIIAVQYYGFRSQGIRYLLHFLGPVPAMAFLILPIEIITEIARPVSLSVRLYGNVFGEDKVVELLATQLGALGTVVAGIVMTPLVLLTSVLQAFVFSLLFSAYISLATQEEQPEADKGSERSSRPPLAAETIIDKTEVSRR